MIRKSTKILIVILLLFSFPSAYADPVKYETDQTLCSTETYKGWPINWWMTYAIREFDKYAPVPGADWFDIDGNGNRAASKFINQAARKGWVVKYDPRDAVVGAMAIKYNPETRRAIIYSIEQVSRNDILVSAIHDGYPVKGLLSYDQLGRESNGLSFVGYIWPTKNEGSKNGEINERDNRVSVIPNETNPMIETLKQFQAQLTQEQTKEAKQVKPNLSWNGKWRISGSFIQTTQKNNTVECVIADKKLIGAVNGYSVTGKWSGMKFFSSIEPKGNFRFTMSPNGNSIKVEWQDGTSGWVKDSTAERVQ